VAGDRPAGGAGHNPWRTAWPLSRQTPAGGVALDRIRVPENVRALDPEDVKALAGSIKIQGMLVPVVLREDGNGRFELVAGFHRIAAAKTLGLVDVPAVIRDVETEAAERAVENVTRKALNPDEEAKAVRAISETSDIARYVKAGVI